MKKMFIRGHNESKHYSYLEPRGNYYLPENKNNVTEFWTEYCQLSYQHMTKFGDSSKTEYLGLAERPEKYMPVIFDVNLAFANNDDDNMINDNDTHLELFIRAIVKAYQDVFGNCLDISDNDVHTYVSVVLKSEYEHEDEDFNYIYSYRIIFPYCRLETRIIKELIHTEAISELKRINAFKYLRVQPHNNWEDIININTLENPVPLYGSINNPKTGMYEIENCYLSIDDEHLDLDNENYDEVCSDISQIYTDIKYHDHVYSGHLSENIIANINPINDEPYPFEYWLPIFLSINYYKKHTQLKKFYNNIYYGNQPSPNNVNQPDEEASADARKPDEICRVLLPMLCKDRGVNDHDMVIVGKSIYNSFNGSSEGLKLWKSFTLERTNKWKDDDFVKKWNTFDISNHFTQRTIGFMARHDNKERYANWHRRWCKPFMDAAIECTHADVAMALKHFYWLDYVCAHPSKKIWYQYRGHRWVKIIDGYNLHIDISTEFVKHYDMYRHQLASELTLLGETDQKQVQDKSAKENMITKINKLTKQLRMNGFKTAVMREAAHLFYKDNEDFLSLLDSNPDLFVATNCVIETSDKAVPRKGIPEDYVSRMGGTHYPRDYSYDHPKVKAVMDWLKMTFIHDDLINHFLYLFSSCLVSGNKNKVFPTLSGDQGNNSKSMWKKLIECVFGSYCITFPLELLTAKKMSSSGPNPELARANKAKVAWLQEPDANTHLNDGALKVMTGGDTFFARMLNEDGGDVIATFTCFMMCNKIPMINGDSAVKNRWRVLPFDSVWVSDDDLNGPAPDSLEEQFAQRRFKMDPNFDQKIPGMAPAMLWLLVQKFAEYKKKGLATPDSVKMATQKYWDQNDVYKMFSNECMELVYKDGIIDENGNMKDPNINWREARNENFRMVAADVYTVFRDWYRENFSGRVPERNSLIAELENKDRWGKREGMYWYGIRQKGTSNDPMSFFGSNVTA